MSKAPSVAKAAPASCDDAVLAPPVSCEASGLPNDSSVAGVLEKVAELNDACPPAVLLEDSWPTKLRNVWSP